MVTRNAYKLFKKVIELSKANEWDIAKKEWEQIAITQADEEEDYGECTCGKYPIKEMIQLFNTKNKNEIIVGNCCVNKFFGIDNSKIFNAIKKRKVNEAIIEDSFKKEIINDWEKDFMVDLWRRKSLTSKQRKIFNKIELKIIKSYKK